MLDLIGLFKSVQAKKARTNSHILKAGFTLIELSIVLVIIGLLLGGIIVGQDLIRAAQIRSVIADIDKYKTAYNTFKGKYNCIPGDCANATDFFGAQTTPDAACAALDYTTPSTSSLTCNGNGNGQVYSNYEYFRFWQHLANAGLIKGKYTGVSGSAGTADHVVGINAPAAAISGSGFGFGYWNFIGGTSFVTYAINYGQFFVLGKEVPNNLPIATIFTPAEAYAFDQKIDDGKPATGLVIARSGYSWNNPSACTTSISNTDFTGAYKIDHNTIACYLHIKTGEY